MFDDYENNPELVNKMFDDDSDLDFDFDDDDDFLEEDDEDDTEEEIVVDDDVSESPESSIPTLSDDEYEDIDKIETKSTNTNSSDEAVEPPKRGRGRPPKNKTEQPNTNTTVVNNTQKINEKQTPTPTPTNQAYVPKEWEYKLRDMANGVLELREFDRQLYHYKPIKDPSNKDTGYFTCHCNIDDHRGSDGQLIWNSDHHCLSGVYSPIHMEKVVSNIKENIAIKSDKVYTDNPFILSWRGVTEQSIPGLGNSYRSRIFAMLTGIPKEDIDVLTNTIEINLDNSYNGKSSIRASFVINLKLSDSNDKITRFRDFFTLNSEHIRVFHKGTFDDLQGKLAELPTKIDNNVDFMKSIPINDADGRDRKYYNAFMFGVRGDYRKEFLNIWSRVPDSMKNLYYASLILSSMLNKEFDNKLRLEWSNTIEKAVKVAKRSQ